MTSEGFVKGSSNNLHIFMVTEFIKNDDRFCSAEFRGVKAAAASRETYGDSAIGYVEVKREGDICTVQGRICPEHRVRSKAYSVSLLVNEVEEKIINVYCKDCAASSGGCKHALAFLMWVNRRSEDPAPTEVQSYWKKPKLCGVGTSKKFILAKEFSTSLNSASPEATTSSFLEEVLSIAREKKCGGQLMMYNSVPSSNNFDDLSVYKLLLQFVEDGHSGAENFLAFARSKMEIGKCKEVETQTRNQSTSSLWHELRYGRVTASKLYEIAKCKTAEGVLVESIIGAYKVKDSRHMKRGRNLEQKVKEAVEKKLKIKVNNCGLFLKPDYPIFGATPDGITDDYVVEIKCPSSSKTVLNYIKNGEVAQKFKAQVQMQMYFANKEAGLFCVADPDFENNSDVNIITINFDNEFLKLIIKDAQENWNNFIFSKLHNSVIC